MDTVRSLTNKIITKMLTVCVLKAYLGFCPFLFLTK